MKNYYKILFYFLLPFYFVSLHSCSNDTNSIEKKTGTEKNYENSAGNRGSYEPGEKVDNFSLKDHEGNTFNLDDNKNREIKVFIFWSVECPVVKAYNDRVVKLYNDYKDKNVMFFPVYSNLTESISDVKEHIKINGYTWKVLLDENNKLADMFNASNTPQAYVLNENNVLVYKGRVDDSRNESSVGSKDLQNALDETLAGKEVTVKSTKAFGCTIKRSK